MSQTASLVLLVSNLYTGMSFYPSFKSTDSSLYRVHSATESSNAFVNFAFCIFQFYNFTFTILYFLLFSEIIGFRDICSCTVKQFFFSVQAMIYLVLGMTSVFSLKPGHFHY